jgi:two-component system, OmpR family, sensor histidine kinase KdpD
MERSLVVGGLVAVASVGAITGLVYGLREVVPVVSTGVAYMLAVLLVSSYWGLWLGLLTSVASAVVFNFFHIPPTDRITIADAENWVALGVFFVAAVVTSTLADAARTRAAEAEQRRKEADLAADMARLLLGSASTGGSLAAVGKRIADAYGLAFVSVELGWRASGERGRAVPLLVEGDRAGTVMVPRDIPGETLESLRSRVVPALEALVGAARRREALESQVIETKALRHSDVVKTTLLRAVSHDLRSPITAIKAAAEALAEDLSEEARRELISVVSGESARLDRLVGNLLDLSRLQSGAAEPRSDWVSVEEIVGGALAAVAEPAGGWELSFDLEVPLIRADAGQLSGRSRTSPTMRCATPGTGPWACGFARPARACSSASAMRARESRVRSSSGSSSPSTAPPMTRVAARASASRSRAGSSRRTAAGYAPSRRPARARLSSSIFPCRRRAGPRRRRAPRGIRSCERPAAHPRL